MVEQLKILGLDIFKSLDKEMRVVERIQKYFNQGIGWHYYLDLAWMLNQIQGLPRGSLILDAGAGTGLAQFILAELGFNVISADFANRTFSKPYLDRYAPIIHYLNDQSQVFDNIYTRHLQETYHATISSGRPTDNTNDMKAHPEKTGGLAIIEQQRLRDSKSSQPNTDQILRPDIEEYCGRIFIYKCDLKDLSLIRDNEVDGIISISALEHNKHSDLQLCIAELLRILKPGGPLVATVGASLIDDWFHEPSKGWCYSEESLKKLFKLSPSTPSNFDRKEVLFKELQQEGNELHQRLAPFYYQSGNNGMPWGKWNPQYQAVGVVKLKPGGLPPKKPTVSIVIPCFNASKTLCRTLETVLNQSFKDYELILIDDGSTDETLSIIQRYSGMHSHFRVLRQENKGVSAARNTGIAAAQADLIAFLDADDIYYGNSLSCRVETLLKESDPDCLGVFCPAEMLFQDGTSMGLPILFDYKLPNNRLYFTFTPESLFNPSCVVVRRNALLKYGVFDESLNHGEDYELWHRLLRGGGYFKIVNNCKIGWTQYAESSVRKRLLKHYLGCKKVSNRIFLYSPSGSTIEECRNGYGKTVFYKSVSDRAFSMSIMALASGDLEAAREISMDIRPYILNQTDPSVLLSRIKFNALRALCRHESTWLDQVWPAIKPDTIKFINELNDRFGRKNHTLEILLRQLQSIGIKKESINTPTDRGHLPVVNRFKTFINDSRKYFTLIIYIGIIIFIILALTFYLLHDWLFH